MPDPNVISPDTLAEIVRAVRSTGGVSSGAYSSVFGAAGAFVGTISYFAFRGAKSWYVEKRNGNGGSSGGSGGVTSHQQGSTSNPNGCLSLFDAIGRFVQQDHCKTYHKQLSENQELKHQAQMKATNDVGDKVERIAIAISGEMDNMKEEIKSTKSEIVILAKAIDNGNGVKR